jgi:hypothetical protein
VLARERDHRGWPDHVTTRMFHDSASLDAQELANVPRKPWKRSPDESHGRDRNSPTSWSFPDPVVGTSLSPLFGRVLASAPPARTADLGRLASEVA